VKRTLEMVCTNCDCVFTLGSKNRCIRCGSPYIEVHQSKSGKKPPRKDKWRDNVYE